MSRLPFRGWLKANAVVVVRLLNSPSTRKDLKIQPILMKPIPLVLLAVFVASASLRSQDAPIVVPPDLTPEQTTYIPSSLVVPAFTPPAPIVQKPLPVIRVDATNRVRGKNGCLITSQRGEASTEPDLPTPAPAATPVGTPELTAAEIARMKWEQRHRFNLGATVYDHQVSKVQWTDPETHEFYEALCGFDIGLLAGIDRFVHEGEHYQFLLLHSDVETAKIRRLAGAQVAQALEIPAGDILITKGNASDVAATAPIRIIKKLINSEKQRLIAYHAAREQYGRQAVAWNAAHPPVPHDEIFVFRPHRGSRYLPNPQPANQGGNP